VESVNAATRAQSIRGQAPTGRRVWFAGPVILSLASLVYIPVVHASCRLEQIAEFRVDMVANSPIIDGQINGQPIRILLETGSPVSFITRTAASQLHLPIRSYGDRAILGADGKESFQTAVVKEFKIGQLVLKNYTAAVVGTAITDANGVAVYQLGADVLTQFTTEWDLGHGVVRFLRPQDCQLGQLAYWSPSYFQANFEPLSSIHSSIELEIQINGKSTKAKLVSGSANSYISPQAAREAGVDTGGPDAKPAGDITGLTVKPIPTWIGRFNTIEVGGETIKNGRLLIGELFPPTRTEWTGVGIPMRVRSYQICLGADFLRVNHVIIVPEKRAALFTYSGGTVFQPERPE
jgi:hypothetical protein